MVLGIIQVVGQIARHICKQHVIGDIGYQHDANAHDERVPKFAQNDPDGDTRWILDCISVLLLHLFQLFLERRRFLRRAAQIKPH